MKQRIQKKDNDLRKQASTNLLKSFENQNSYKKITFGSLERPQQQFVEDSIFNPKSSKSKAAALEPKQSQNERFKFFQGDQSVFSKEFTDDQSRFYHDQSSILTSKENLHSADYFGFNEDESLLNHPKYQILKNIDGQLDELSNNLKNPDRNALLNILDNLQTDAKEIKDNYQLLLKILEMKGKIIRDIGDYMKSVGVLKQARLYCNISKNYEKKLYFYKLILDMYIQMREYDNALVYAKKMLRLAWIMNDVEYEITSYDKIGMIKYYQGDLPLADYFHEKAYSNTREPKNSQIRKVGENIVRKNKKHYNIYSQNNFETDSEDDFDLGLFSNVFLRKRSSDIQHLEDSSSLPSLKQKIPVPRKVNEHIRKYYDLGRIDIPIEKKKNFINEHERKYIYNQLSLNRNLKNFMIQQYVNHGFWAGSQDQLSKIKFYHLHRNLKNHLNMISRIRKYNYTLKNNLKYENILDQHNESYIIQNPNSNNRQSIIVNEDYFNHSSRLHNQISQNNLLSSQIHLDSISNLHQIDYKSPTKTMIPTLPRINNHSIVNLSTSKTPTSTRIHTIS